MSIRNLWRLGVAGLSLAGASAQAGRILLVPLDSRPAAGQFAQMIARIANQDLRMPPYESLGRFTNPGSPDDILRWLSQQDLTNVDTAVVSADMVCYGGLVASRTTGTSAATALARLETLNAIFRRAPKTKLYVFSSTMRLAPTATRSAATWRMKLARYEELKDMLQRMRITRVKAEMESLRLQIPPGQIERYEECRVRDYQVQKALVTAAAKGDIHYLAIGQDDAKPYGPQIAETEALRTFAKKERAEGRVYFCEGIDQHASVLVSRAMLRAANWTPRVQVVYSDPMGRKRFAAYESKSIEKSLSDQLTASGARLAGDGERYDYTLYVNTPGRRVGVFHDWLVALRSELDQGFPIAVADINLGGDGTADHELFDMLSEQSRFLKLIGFAGWNTAGNTMGTVVPAANVYLLAKRLDVSAVQREVARREFLLHRVVDDYAFHKYTRPLAYAMVLSPSRDEVYGIDFTDINGFVQRDVEKHVERVFQSSFLNDRFEVDGQSYVISGIRDVKVWLPWPRAYEMRLEFKLEAKPEETSGSRH